MYVFGGKDDDNLKLNDLWQFDFQTKSWTQMQVDASHVVSRSGHSACLFKDFMIVFAGIHEVTKELDDMVLFNFKTLKWITIFKEGSNNRQNEANFLAQNSFAKTSQ